MEKRSADSENQWKCGFMNQDGDYLTAEPYGFKVNACGKSLKKKQLWTIEQDKKTNNVFIRSYLGRYMTADRYGNVSVEAEEKAGADPFTVEYSLEGKWAVKHAVHANYLSGSKENVKCFDKTPGTNWWSMNLYVHPQVNLLNAQRKRYVNLNKDANELECSKLIPWGAGAVIILNFKADGKYTLRSNNRMLNCDGGLDEKDAPEKENKFMVEIHSGCLAFKDHQGRYLTAVGKGTMKGRNKTVTNDEKFTIEDSHPQVQLIAHTNKYVSIKQSMDVSANQTKEDDIGDSETFQLEFLKDSNSWAFKTNSNKYWSFDPTKGTISLSLELTKNGRFDVEWLEDNKVAIKGPDGKYFANKPTGILFSASNTLEDVNKFTMVLVNRPLLVLKCEHGFVDRKGDQFFCNKATYGLIEVIPTAKGSYNLKAGGKYLGLGDDKAVCLDGGPSDFYFQFVGQSTMAIKAQNGLYLQGEQNGLFRAVAEEISPNALWEY